jgi:hypothetical protein
MLANPAIEEEMEKSMDRMASSEDGVYKNIFDGKVCKELPCKDGSLFFSPSDEVRQSGELRIGVTLGVDWYDLPRRSIWLFEVILAPRFSYLRSQIAPSHTSCPMSYSVINLPPHLRYVRGLATEVSSLMYDVFQIPNSEFTPCRHHARPQRS